MPEGLEEEHSGESQHEPEHGGLFEQGMIAPIEGGGAAMGGPIGSGFLEKERLSEGKRGGNIWAVHRVRSCRRDSHPTPASDGLIAGWGIIGSQGPVS